MTMYVRREIRDFLCRDIINLFSVPISDFYIDNRINCLVVISFKLVFHSTYSVTLFNFNFLGDSSLFLATLSLK